jgi:hypothetical protein
VKTGISSADCNGGPGRWLLGCYLLVDGEFSKLINKASACLTLCPCTANQSLSSVWIGVGLFVLPTEP